MTRVLVLLIQTYRVLMSPWLAPRCRFLPTCSVYSVQALTRFGAWRGTRLALRRISRCHPWGGSGIDEVPEHWPPAQHQNKPWFRMRSGEHVHPD